MTEHDLYRAVREAGGEEPPAALDARILAAAHEAVNPAVPRRASWVARFAPYSVAAVAILGVALSLRVAQDSPPHSPLPAERTGSPSAGASADRAPPASAPAGADAASAERQSQPSLQDAPAAKRVAPLTEGREAAALKPQAAKPEVERAPARKDAADSLVVPGSAVSSTSSPALVADPAGAAGVGRAAEPAYEPERRRREQPAEQRALSPAPLAPAVSSLREEATSIRDADSWLADIDRLLAIGEAAQARESLREFRRAYPEHPLPPTLQSLLDRPGGPQH